ncbi:MAG: hypothetical protein RSA96_07965 [Erysipelotrichaceae bacterium]
MKTNKIKELLNTAVSKQVPPLLDSIVEVPITKKEVFSMNTQVEKKSNKRSMLMFATASIAVCCLGFFAITSLGDKEAITLSLDINPSIELALNKNEKVIKVEAKNKDAEKIIADMDLKDVKSDIALNAIVGSLYKNGYFDEKTKDNDVLLSISNKDKAKTKELEFKYVKMLKGILNENKTSGIILAQKDALNETTKKLSEKYNISVGKASLIEKILAKSSNLSFDQLAKMNIKDIVGFMNENKLKVDDIDTQDTDDAEDLLDDLQEAEEDKIEDAEEAKEKEKEKAEDEADKAKEKAEKEKDKAKKEQEKLKEAQEKEQEKLEKEQELAQEKEQEAKEAAENEEADTPEVEEPAE